MIEGQAVSSENTSKDMLAAASQESDDLREGMERVKSRFGEIVINREKAIFMPNGLLGIPGRQYCLAALPSEKLKQFRVLQCLDDMSMAFAVLPMERDNPIIAPEDVDMACRDLGINPSSVIIMLVVTVLRQPEGTRITANARAPILVDGQTRMGAQYVYQNSKYDIRQMIS